MDAAQIKRALAEAGLRPNAALGQNFCVDEARLAAIADAADVTGRPVLEVGPGLGALTEPLLARAARVVAVEKDAALAALLTARLGETAGARLTVHTADILRFDVAAAMGAVPGAGGAGFCVAGNLPYYITTPIVERLLPLLPLSLTLMVQREAAARFSAGPGARVYGPVAAFSQTYYTVRHVMDVPRDSYYPQPDVDSSVVHLARRDVLPAADPAAFFAFLRRAFAMRRKTLWNNLARAPQAAAALAALGLPADVRAEALAPASLLAVFDALPPGP